jgi:organic radical activating enzyme
MDDINSKILQVHPTSVCNRNCCSFCSYRSNNKEEYLTFNEVFDFLLNGIVYNYRIAKFSGGGEPLCHPQILSMFKAAKKLGYTIYIQTNGILLDYIFRDTVDNIRVSYGDGIKFSPDKVDVDGYSYVVTTNPDYDNLNKLVNYAIDNNKYVKITQDDTGEYFIPIKAIKYNVPNSPLITYWDVTKYHKGFRNCPSATNSPLLGFDSYIYPCCRTNYSKGLVCGYNISMRIDIEMPYSFDGSKCIKCYYDNDLHSNPNCVENIGK